MNRSVIVKLGYTPGPWKNEGLDGHGGVYITSKLGQIGFVSNGNMANADLIAAAPRMAEAYEDIITIAEALEYGDITPENAAFSIIAISESRLKVVAGLVREEMNDGWEDLTQEVLLDCRDLFIKGAWECEVVDDNLGIFPPSPEIYRAIASGVKYRIRRPRGWEG